MAVSGIGMEPGSSAAFDFVNFRMRAEENARITARRSGKLEILLKDIYDAMPCLPGEWTAEKLMDLELKVEDMMLRPVLGFAEKIAAARNGGARVVFISDMYLPEDFIVGQLKKYGFWKEGDKIYVSHNHGAIKFDGSLFDVVLKNEGIRSAELVHEGDHKLSDHAIPRSKGIKAELVDHHYNEFERAWMTGAAFTPHSKDVELMASLSRSFRLQGPDSTACKLITSVIAPMFVPFVGAILKDASARNINRLYFQARDGKVLFQIAKELVKDHPGMEVRYLYGSRRSFYLPGLVSRDKGMLDWFLHGSEGRTPMEMLMRLNLDESILLPHLERFGESASFLQERMDVHRTEKLKSIMHDDQVFDALFSASAEQRKIVKAYLEQEGLMEAGSFGVVDIGWSKLSLQCLSNIVGDNKIFGYFIAVFRERYNREDAAGYYSAIYPEALPGDSFDLLFSSATIAFLEQFMAMTNEASCIGYEKVEGKVRPRFGKMSVNADRYAGFIEQRDSCLEQYCRDYRMVRPMLRHEDQLASACGLRSLMVMFENPDDKLIDYLIPFQPDNGVDDQITFIRKLSATDMASEIFQRARGHKMSSAYLWREGSIQYSFGRKGMKLFNYLKHHRRGK